MSEEFILHKLSIPDFTKMVERMSLKERRELLPELNRHVAVRKQTWLILHQKPSEYKSDLPLEAQFSYQMLLNQVDNYDKHTVTELLIDTFRRLLENEDICKHEAGFDIF